LSVWNLITRTVIPWICLWRVALVLFRARPARLRALSWPALCVHRRASPQESEGYPVVLLVESVGVEEGTEILVRDETSSLTKDGVTGPRV
jgi:hypothetical protein